MWEGEAADAAQEPTYRDLLKVRGLADTLREAHAIARRGAADLAFAKRQAMQAVSEAEATGLAVAEDLSVTSHYQHECLQRSDFTQSDHQKRRRDPRL